MYLGLYWHLLTYRSSPRVASPLSSLRPQSPLGTPSPQPPSRTPLPIRCLPPHRSLPYIPPPPPNDIYAHTPLPPRRAPQATLTPSGLRLDQGDNEETGHESRGEDGDGTAHDDSMVTAPTQNEEHEEHASRHEGRDTAHNVSVVLAPMRKGPKRGHKNKEHEEPASRHEGGDDNAFVVPVPMRKGRKWDHQNEENEKPTPVTGLPTKKAKPKPVRSLSS